MNNIFKKLRFLLINQKNFKVYFKIKKLKNVGFIQNSLKF